MLRLPDIYGSHSHAIRAGLDATADFHGGASVPIGRPLANLRAYVLDAQLQLAPVMVPGELMMSGIQVARGYLNRPDLTAEKFVANPYSNGHPHHERLYRTGTLIVPCHWMTKPVVLHSGTVLMWSVSVAGDLARWLPDGNLAFLGRMDYQVRCNMSHCHVQGGIGASAYAS